MKKEDFELKKSLDKNFNEIFFGQEFINSFLNKFKYCPSGLTIDTCFDDDIGLYFYICCKKYGYEYSNEQVTGDYKYQDFKKTDEIVSFMKNYLKDYDVWDIIKNFNFI